MRKAFGFIGKVLFWGVVVVGLAAAGALLLVMNHLDEAVRTEVQQVFANHYQGLHVSVRSAQRVEGQGLFIRGLSIKDPHQQGPWAELLYVDEVFLATKTTIDELVLGELRIDHVALRRMSLRAMRMPDGTWSSARLLPLPSFGGQMSTASIEDGTVEILDPRGETPAALSLRRIQMKLAPATIAGGGTAAESEVLQVEGQLTSDLFRQGKFRGWLQPGSGRWSIAGDAQSLAIAPATWQALPAPLTEDTDILARLNGKADLTFAAAHETADGPIQFDVQGNVYEGRYESPQLPFPLRDITANVRLTNRQLNVTQLVAKGGGATLQMNLQRDGWRDDSPLHLQAAARRFQVGDSMADVLPGELAALWKQYRPSGLLDADVSVTFDGETWAPELTVRCLDTSFMYEKFPYPISSATGTITLKDDALNFAVEAFAGETPVKLTGRFDDPLGKPAGWVDFATDGSVPIDARLHAALDTDSLRTSRDLLLAMKARGGLSSTGRIDVKRLPSGAMQIGQRVIVRIHDGSVQYEKFPYPLHHITGEVELWNGQYTFRDLQGRNDSGQISGQGTYTDTGPQPQLTMNFACRDLPLEDELRSALPASQQDLWASLRPQGTIDRLNLRLNYFPRGDQTQIDAVAVKWPEHAGSPGQPISIFPRAFPYRLNQVEGEIRYRNGTIELTKVKAFHGPSEFQAAGFCQMGGDGSWRFQLSQLNTKNLTLDRDLVSAFPDELAAGIAPLNLRGPLALDGAVELRKGPAVDDPVSSNWDFNIDIENGQLQCGTTISNIHGEVRLVGAATEQGMYSRGELNIDSLMYHGFQFTRLTGPIWIDRERVAFGAWADQPRQGQPPRRLQATVLGGTVSGDVHVALDGDKYFTLQAQLDQADLAQYAREHVPRQRNITGQANATLRLTGTSRGMDTLRGDGKVWLRKAVLSELPVMVALLKILSVKPVDKTAFTASDVDFRINGENIYLDRIVFNGDAISLKGAGEVNFDRRVNLKFYTLVGNESRRIPIIWPLLADASRRILMIEVTGSLDNPVTTRNVLPGLNSTIERLFSEELGTAEAPNRPQFQR